MKEFDKYITISFDYDGCNYIGNDMIDEYTYRTNCI